MVAEDAERRGGLSTQIRVWMRVIYGKLLTG